MVFYNLIPFERYDYIFFKLSNKVIYKAIYYYKNNKNNKIYQKIFFIFQYAFSIPNLQRLKKIFHIKKINLIFFSERELSN